MLTDQRAIQQEVISKVYPTIETGVVVWRPTTTFAYDDHAHDNISLYDFDTMKFSYPHYNVEPDAEAHVRSFFNMWRANHMSQRLAEADTNASKIPEFGLTLNGRAARWHSQVDLATFTNFEQL